MSPDNETILAYCTVEGGDSPGTFYAEKYVYNDRVDEFQKETDPD